MRNTKLDGVKGTLRTFEGVIEVLILSLAYYFIWTKFYVHEAVIDDHGNNQKMPFKMYPIR